MRIRHIIIVLTLCLQVGFCQRQGVSVHGVASDYMMFDSEIAKLPQRTIKVKDHGKNVRFQGVLLADILARVHTPNSNEAGSHYLAAEGANGDQAMFSWVELDPSFSHKAVYVVTKRNGEALSKDEGPFELMVPGEKNNASSVSVLPSAIHRAFVWAAVRLAAPWTGKLAVPGFLAAICHSIARMAGPRRRAGRCSWAGRPWEPWVGCPASECGSLRKAIEEF